MSIFRDWFGSGSVINEGIKEAKKNAERRQQAREFIQRAKELVREGDEIYERAYGKVTSYASETEYKLRQHMNYKKQIAKELGGTIDGTLKDFGRFNIDAKTFSAPSVQERSAGLPVFTSAVSACMPRLDTPSIFDIFASEDDYYEAKRQRDEAKYYKERMRSERDKLNNYKEKMSEIRTFIDTERSELDSLMEKLKKMTGELKSGMQKSSFSIQEADYFKGIHKIAEYIVTLLSTEFLGDSFSISQRYQKVFDGVKEINRSIPYAPSISDNNTATAIKRILDGSIMY